MRFTSPAMAIMAMALTFAGSIKNMPNFDPVRIGASGGAVFVPKRTKVKRRLKHIRGRRK